MRELASTYVEAFQSKGIMTVAKHYGFNQQETRRNTYDALVRSGGEGALLRTLQRRDRGWCLAVMCAYNKLNGHHACALRTSCWRAIYVMGWPSAALSFPTGRRRINTMLAWTWRCPVRGGTILGILGAGRPKDLA